MNVCVYCASSRRIDAEFGEQARRLGQLLARQGINVLYGGGAVGSMGDLANGALAEGGRVTGIIPTFMMEREWGHRGLTELRVVDDMHTRKAIMMREADAVVALPGGSGTFEELLEAITWKRLALIDVPIVIVNVRGYYDPLVELLQRSVDERFMTSEDGQLWQVVHSAEEALTRIA